jgi:RNA polymerase sigma factor for flagellar operon FliA
MEREAILTALAQRMVKLPTITKKVLAMYYYQNMRILDIAACFGLPEASICEMHLQAVESLRTFWTTLKAEQTTSVDEDFRLQGSCKTGD